MIEKQIIYIKESTAVIMQTEFSITSFLFTHSFANLCGSE